MILVHGDLRVQEKINTILQSRSIEDDLMEWMNYLLPVPRLFHIRMACIDAINRMHASGSDLQPDPNGLYLCLVFLYPNSIAKLQKKVPPFCMMNDGIWYIMQMVILDMWAENVSGNLQHYINSQSSWEDIKQQARKIAMDCFDMKGDSNDQQ